MCMYVCMYVCMYCDILVAALLSPVSGQNYVILKNNYWWCLW